MISIIDRAALNPCRIWMRASAASLRKRLTSPT
jgi:hypothetical protein